MKMRVLINLSFIVCITGISTSALSMPVECLSGRGAAGYQAGFNVETNTLDLLWQRFGDCQFMEDFVQAIDLPFGSSSSNSPYLRCRNVGIAEAMTTKLDNVILQCGADCLDSGISIGTLTGQSLCGVYQREANYFEPSLCSLTSRQGCRTALIDYVSGHCPSVRNEDMTWFNSFVDTSCDL